MVEYVCIRVRYMLKGKWGAGGAADFKGELDEISETSYVK